MLASLDEAYELSLRLISEYEAELAEIRRRKELKFGIYNKAKLDLLMSEYSPGDWLHPTDECDEDSAEYLIGRHLAYILCKMKLILITKNKTDRYYYQLSLDAGAESIWRIAESHGLVGGEQREFLGEMLKYLISDRVLLTFIRGATKRKRKR